MDLLAHTRTLITHIITIAATLLIASTSPIARDRPLPSQNPETVAAARVVEVIDGDTVVIDTGAEVRLTGIQAPKLPLGRKNFKAWPLSADAKKALHDILQGKTIRLSYPGRRIDRWGRLLAHVHVGSIWVQEEMLKRGFARVYTFADNRAGADRLYRAEEIARKAGRGIWGNAFYRIRTPPETEKRVGTFQIVEGIPVAVAVVRGRGFVNFGKDWRTDFTIVLEPRDLKRFRAGGINIRTFEKRRIRVRGWLLRRNGPMIRATHPEQIELADP